MDAIGDSRRERLPYHRIVNENEKDNGVVTLVDDKQIQLGVVKKRHESDCVPGIVEAR